MNINFSCKDTYGSALPTYVYKTQTREHSVEQFVADSLATQDAHANDLEVAARDATNALLAIGRLMDVLAEKGILDMKDILKVAESRAHEDEKGHVLIREMTSPQSPEEYANQLYEAEPDEFR